MIRTTTGPPRIHCASIRKVSNIRSRAPFFLILRRMGKISTFIRYMPCTGCKRNSQAASTTCCCCCCCCCQLLLMLLFCRLPRAHKTWFRYQSLQLAAAAAAAAAASCNKQTTASCCWAALLAATGGCWLWYIYRWHIRGQLLQKQQRELPLRCLATALQLLPTVVFVFTLNRSFYATTSAVPPVSFLTLHPRDTQILWSQLL